MSRLHPPTSINTLKLLWQAIAEHPLRMGTPLAMAVAAAVSYAALRPCFYESKVALTLRPESGASSRPGVFASIDEMQSAHETVLEVLKRPSIARAALAKIGPPSQLRIASWPQESDVDRVIELSTMAAPKGSEFGRTEVMYLVTRAQGAERAGQLNQALFHELDKALQEVRATKAVGLILELEQRVELVRQGLADATQRLTSVEQEVGDDLAELRMLNESLSGESNLRGLHVAIKNELRQARVEQRTNQDLVRLLEKARDNPEHLLATPNELLTAQPALQRIKEGLVDAQLRTATLQGELSPEHPRVRATMTAQVEIQQRLTREIQTSVESLKAAQSLAENRVASLESQLSDVQRRMSIVASMRANYGNLVDEVRSHSETLKAAQRDLADAQASRLAARNSNILTAVDQPVVSDRPVGPSAAMILAVGLMGGLAMGLGTIVLSVPAFPSDWFGEEPECDEHEKSVVGLRREATSHVVAARRPAPTRTLGPAEPHLAAHWDHDQNPTAKPPSQLRSDPAKQGPAAKLPKWELGLSLEEIAERVRQAIE